MLDADNARIICLTPNPWHSPTWMSRHHLAAELGRRGWPVIYSHGRLNLSNRRGAAWAGGSWAGRFENVRLGAGIVTVDRPARLLAAWPRLPATVALATRLHARRLLHAPGHRGRHVVSLLCAPRYAPYLDWLEPAATVVLYVYDAWWLNRNWTEANRRNLERLVARADLVVTSARSMARDLPGDGPERARVLDHAVDFDAFEHASDTACPERLASIPRPRIAYVGTVGPKVDLALVTTIARRRPDWHWVFVGEYGIGYGADRAAWAQSEACRALPNVHFLGAVGPEAVPAYMTHADVNTMCYRAAGGHWQAGNPLKLYQYLAAGKPIVSTGLENVQRYSDVIAVADGADEWQAAIERALACGGPGDRRRRRAIARENTWARRVDELEAWLAEPRR